MQVMLINSAKDVASSLSHLVNSAKNASGKQASDPAMGLLKESAKVSGFVLLMNGIFASHTQLLHDWPSFPDLIQVPHRWTAP